VKVVSRSAASLAHSLLVGSYVVRTMILCDVNFQLSRSWLGLECMWMGEEARRGTHVDG